jgi:hypothetical protein
VVEGGEDTPVVREVSGDDAGSPGGAARQATNTVPHIPDSRAAPANLFENVMELQWRADRASIRERLFRLRDLG